MRVIQRIQRKDCILECQRSSIDVCLIQSITLQCIGSSQLGLHIRPSGFIVVEFILTICDGNLVIQLVIIQIQLHLDGNGVSSRSSATSQTVSRILVVKRNGTFLTGQGRIVLQLNVQHHLEALQCACRCMEVEELLILYLTRHSGGGNVISNLFNDSVGVVYRVATVDGIQRGELKRNVHGLARLAGRLRRAGHSESGNC